MDLALIAPVAPLVPVPPFSEWFDGVHYPSGDGQPMCENTRQYDWIVLLKENLEEIFAPPAAVFIAADVFWYPVRGRPDIRLGPDVLVALGRPKGARMSYRQWEEADLPPQVVFEILSPGNRKRELARKFAFYERYGVQEYCTYNPFPEAGYPLRIWQRREGRLAEVVLPAGADWRSPLLGIGFGRDAEGALRLTRPDGRPFRTRGELSTTLAQTAAALAQAAAREQVLAARLRALGVDPTSL